MDFNAQAKIYTVYVSAIIRETADTKSFQLKTTGPEIPYSPGQFLTFLFKGKNGQEIRRSYSISSSPILDEPLTITVKRIDNGEISRLLHDRTIVGDIFNTIGASGFFTIPKNIKEYTQFIFFAAGSGIVPVYSIIKTLLSQNAGIKLLLIYSNNNIRSTIFYDELLQFQKYYPGIFEIELLFSNAQHLRHARLTPESLDQVFLHHQISSSPENLFYLCGPPGYMRMIQFKLSTLSIPASNIKREIFHIEKPAHIRMPPDIHPHDVFINIQGRREKITVEFPETILSVAKKRQIPLPYSCENGQCGTCAVTCVSGTVWMSNNEVLLDEELANGKVLTCTGFPVNGDVFLSV